MVEVLLYRSNTPIHPHAQPLAILCEGMCREVLLLLLHADGRSNDEAHGAVCLVEHLTGQAQ